jgi:recombination protein RecA
MGLQARLMSQALRKLTGAVAQSKTILIFINQIRNKIGVMFGNPETTTGGLALKFYATLRMDIRRIENIKEGDVVVGARARVKIVKNKVAPPYRTAEFEMIHGYGVSREGCLIDMGVEAQLVEKSGSWFLYQGERLGQGRENAKAYLKQHGDVAEKLEKALRAKYLVGPAAQAAAAAAAEKEEAATKAELEAAEKAEAAKAPAKAKSGAR